MCVFQKKKAKLINYKDLIYFGTTNENEAKNESERLNRHWSRGEECKEKESGRMSETEREKK